MMKLMYLFFFFLLSTTSFAKEEYLFENLTFGFGSWLENYDGVQVNSSGSTKNYDFTPYMSLAMDYRLFDEYLLIPEIGYILQRDAGNSSIKKNHFFIRTDFAYYVKKWLRLRAGTSFMILVTSGDGGEKTIDGQTYYIPNERSTALNQTIDLGADFIFDRLSLRINRYYYGFRQPEEEESVTYSFSLNYLVPLKEI